MRLLPDTSERRLTPERMDDPSLAAAPHRRALLGLSRINRFSRSARSIWAGLRGLGLTRRGRHVRVLDIACGGGDVTVGLQRLAERDGVDVRVDGCDISPIAVEAAGQRAGEAGVGSSFFVHDVLAGPLPGGYDAVVCSLFLHHLTDPQVVDVLLRVSEASHACVISDLSRGKSGYVAAWVGTRVLTRSPIVHFDGPVSVRAALTVEEMRGLCACAGLTDTAFERAFPCRWLMTWSRG